MSDKKPKTYKFIGCNLCHRVSGDKGVTLIKGTDSYYCLSCYNVLQLKKRKEERDGK